MDKILDKYVRDDSTGALLNTDNAGLEAYKKRKLNLKRKDNQISEMSKDINNLKEDLFEIKSVLQTIVQKFE